jgi:hypothetical protein
MPDQKQIQACMNELGVSLQEALRQIREGEWIPKEDREPPRPEPKAAFTTAPDKKVWGAGVKGVKKDSKLERMICLAYAKGILPSIIAQEVDYDLVVVEEILRRKQDYVKELVDILGLEYQLIRIQNMIDVGMTRLEEKILDPDTNDKDFGQAFKDLLNMQKNGDLEKLFNLQLMKGTYEDTPEEVDLIQAEIDKAAKRLREMGVEVVT